MADDVDLFGDPLPKTAPKRARLDGAKRGSENEPAAYPIKTEHVELAQRLPRSVRIGTSSWSYVDWAGIIFDRGYTQTQLSRKGLPAYAQHPLLRTVGVDRSYYTPMTGDEYAFHAQQVPDDFIFLVKAPQMVTGHRIAGGRGYTAQRNPTFLDADAAMKFFIEPTTEGLGKKAGPLVFQFSPLGADATKTPELMIERLLAFFDALRARAGKDPYIAVEVRNATLVTPAFAQGLADIKVDYCVGVQPKMPSVEEQISTMAIAMTRGFVARWHLNPNTGRDYEAAKDFYAPYNQLVDEDPVTRAALAGAVVATVAQSKPALVITGNKAEGSSPLSAFKLAQAIVDTLPTSHQTT